MHRRRRPGGARRGHRRLDLVALADLARAADAQAAEQGLPRRLRCTVTLPSLAGGTRTSVTTYEYAGWGGPVDPTD